MSFKTTIMIWRMNMCKKRIKRYKKWIEKEKSALKEYEEDLEFEKYMKMQKENRPRKPNRFAVS